MRIPKIILINIPMGYILIADREATLPLFSEKSGRALDLGKPLWRSNIWVGSLKSDRIPLSRKEKEDLGWQIRHFIVCSVSHR